MYSEVVNGLGISQNAMEMIVFFGIVISVIGVVLVLYWKYIVVGALAIGCVAVMANHKSTEKPVVSPVIEKKQETINQVKPVENPVVPEIVDISKGKTAPSGSPSVKPSEQTPKSEEPKDMRSQFMERCINLADYTRTQCDELWDDRVREERELLEETKLKGKKHGHYRKV